MQGELINVFVYLGIFLPQTSDMIKYGFWRRARHRVVRREQFPHCSKILKGVVNLFACDQFPWTVVPSISSITVVFDHCYQMVSFQVFLIGLHPSLHLKIVGTKCFDNLHKREVVETIPQAMLGDGFEDFYQTGRRWGDAITRRKQISDKKLKLFGINSILEQFFTNF